jgi:hypothetical protein
MGGGLIINICEYSVILTYMYFWMSGGGFTVPLAPPWPKGVKMAKVPKMLILFFFKQIIF